MEKPSWAPSWTVLIGVTCVLLGGVLSLSGLFTSAINIPIITGFGVAIIFFTTMWGEMRYRSPQFVTQSVHGSFDDFDTDESGKWAIVPIGTCKAMYYYERGGLGTVVVPVDSLEWSGTNMVSHTNPDQCGMDALPPEVVPIVNKGKEYKPPFWYSPLVISNPNLPVKGNYALVVEENKGANQVINRLLEIIRHDFHGLKNIADLIGDFQRLREKRSVKDIFLPRQEPKPGEER